jgi:hypothetical protein
MTPTSNANTVIVRADTGRAGLRVDRDVLRAHSHTPRGSSTAAAIIRNAPTSGTRNTRISAPITTPGRVAAMS